MKRIIVERSIHHLNEDVASITKKAKVARTQVASEICFAIRKMVNDINYNDVVFLCKDGIPIHASRLFLVARNAVFHRMLSNGMAESQLSKIILREISSTALLPVMEFLYTGILQEHAPKDWRNAYEIIGVAKFFLLEELELIVVDYLLLDVTKMGMDTEAVAKYLSIAVEFVGVFDENVDLVARNLVCIFESASDSLKPEHLHALTEEAFKYFLDKTQLQQKTKYQIADPELLLNAEFLRLKNILLWCACREFTSQGPLTIQAVSPEIVSTLELLETSSYELCHPSEIYCGIKTALALSVKPYLPLVNFQKISPRYLANIFEPMGIIPSSILMDAFRFHALRTHNYTFRTHDYIVDNFHWLTNCSNDEIYKMSTDGTVIQKMAAGIGFAMYDLRINNYGRDLYYRWEIIIEEICESFIEIGLYHDDDNKTRDGQSLSGHPGGWALRMDSQGLFINRTGIHRAHKGDTNFAACFRKDYSHLVYGKNYGHKNSKIEINFEVYDNMCQFIVKNDKLEDLASNTVLDRTGWSHFPHGDFYPAVSLGTGSSGRVRIRFLQVGQDFYEDKSSEI